MGELSAYVSYALFAHIYDDDDVQITYIYSRFFFTVFDGNASGRNAYGKNATDSTERAVSEVVWCLSTENRSRNLSAIDFRVNCVKTKSE